MKNKKENQLQDKKQSSLDITPRFQLDKQHTQVEQISIQEPLRKKIKKDNLYKPPTSEELNNLREAETLFHSSLFRLQTNEFLKEVKLKEKWKKKFDKWFQLLKSELLSLKHGKVYELGDMTWLKKKGIKFPIPKYQKSSNPQKGVFKFQPPTDIEIVGSYALDLTSKLNFTIDVSLEVSKEFWQHGDYLNGCYSTKRALYLCHLCWALRQSSLVEETQFTCPQGDHTRPALILIPKGDWKTPVKVCLLPHPPAGFFKLSRFRPSNNNVRPSWFYQDSQLSEDISTPAYNASMIMDLLLLDYVKHFQDILKDAQGVKEALILLRAWLRHRGLLEGYGSFSAFLMTMLVCHLLVTRRITWMMSSYQVIRNVFLELAQGDWCKNGLSMSKHTEENQPTLEDFHKYYDVVFVDHTGFLNLCASMSSATFKRVKHEAQLGIDLLNSFWNDSFEALFMVPLPFAHKFDHIFCLSNPAELKKSVDVLQAHDRLLDHSGNVGAAILSKVLGILERALGKRIINLDISLHPNKTWLPEELPPKDPLCRPLKFGILLDQESSNAVIEKGPTADKPEATEFRSFWGEKSELRRFQDGSILEAVLWPAQGLSELRIISKQIVQFALERHCSINMLDYIGDQLDQFLNIPGLSPATCEIPYGIGEEAHIGLIHSLDSLSKSLRQLQGLSLSVTSVQGISAVFRFAEVFPPLPSNYPVDHKSCVIHESKCLKLKEDLTHCPPFVQPLEVVLHMEGSGKWPDSLEAMRRVKAALHIELASVLTSNLDLITLPNTTHLDVLKDGYVFRLQVACRKELVLLKQVVTPEGSIKIKETEQYHKMNILTEMLPRLTSILHGIQQQFPVFGVTCRLAKRWVASHLLLQLHFPDVCVELLVAHLFLHSAPFSPPNSPFSGFLRFLLLLSHHDWKTTPLIINLNQNFKKEDVSEIQSHFTSHRPVLPAMFLSTPLDRTNSIWTRRAPSGTILHRLTSLAQASLQILQNTVEDLDTSKFKILFTPSMDMYDVIIHLQSKQVPKRYQSVNNDKKQYRLPPMKDESGKVGRIMPVVGFDPVQCYLKDLQDSFDEFALFFYDVFGGGVIGVVWKPHAFQPKPFKVSHVNGRKEGSTIIDSKKSLIPNIEAILQDFAVLGAGLVQRIQTKTEKWTID